MKFDIAGVFEQVVAFYSRLPLSQKVALPLLIAASMGVIIFVSKWATQPQYGLLFSDLEEADAAAVVERLKEDKIKFRLREDGKTVDVTPPEIVHELRLQLASMGLPKGGNVGYELWNEVKLGQTQFGEIINKIRAIQGELERTISSIDAIKAVRVHITSPKRSVFVKRDTPPTASVLLRLKAGYELDKGQIKGIANLVANSVERLTAENVTILDQHGNMLNERRDEEISSGADMTRLEYQRKIEGAYVKRIETMLTEVLGPGRVVARVTANLDFSKFEKEEEQYDPAGAVMRSERTSEESAGLTAEGGIPGVISNMTNNPGVLTPPDSTENQNRRKESVVNYEISRAVSRLSSAPGKIEKLSVAVLVDGERVKIATGAKSEDGTDVMKEHYKALTAERIRKIENLVKQAVGFDAARGDTVSVENIAFREPEVGLLEALESAEKQQFWMNVGFQWVGPIILLVFFFMVVVKPLVRFLVTPTESEIDLSRLLPAGIEELEAELEAERAKLSSMPERVAQPAVDIEELETLLSENSRMVRESPQQAALLIRYWLNDGRI